MIPRTIAVVDLDSGTITDCMSDTVTFDVPGLGTRLVSPVHPRPLSWRAGGEECLVLQTRGKTDEIAYRLCAVDPAPG
jgi:hypothetical protein